MALFKRPGSPNWFTEFETNGERVRSSTGTSTKRIAERVELKLRTEIHERQVLGKVEDMTFHEASLKYFDTVIAPKGNKEVAKRDAYALKAIEKDLGPQTKLSRISAKTLSDYSDKLQARGLAVATVNRHLATVRAILRKAHRKWRALAVVPIIELLPLDNKRTGWLSDDEEARLLAECSPHLRDLVIFLLDTGVE